MQPTTLDLLISYVDVFIQLFAAAGNTIIGVMATVIGVLITLFQGG